MLRRASISGVPPPAPLSRRHCHSQSSGRGGFAGRHCSPGFRVIVPDLLKDDVRLSRRALLGGISSLAGALALGGCAGMAANGARFEASSLTVDPTLLIATTRKPVSGGRA